MGGDWSAKKKEKGGGFDLLKVSGGKGYGGGKFLPNKITTGPLKRINRKEHLLRRGGGGEKGRKRGEVLN